MKTTKGARVPRTLKKFDNYLRTVVTFLLSTNTATGNTWWVDLLLGNAEINQAQQYLGKWYTGNPASPGLWEIHINPKTKGKDSRKNVVILIRDFALFFSPLLTRMSGSPNITPSARLVLHVAEPNTSRTRHNDDINEQCFGRHIELGGGEHQLTCCTTHDFNKPGLPETGGVDGVRVSYTLVNTIALNAKKEMAAEANKIISAANARTASETPVTLPVIEVPEIPTPPASAEECDSHEDFRGGKLRLKFSAHKGWTLYVYLQWNDSKHKGRVGPEGDLITIVV